MPKPVVIQGELPTGPDLAAFMSAKADLNARRGGADKQAVFDRVDNALDYFEWSVEMLRGLGIKTTVSYHVCPHADGELGDFNCRDAQWGLREEAT